MNHTQSLQSRFAAASAHLPLVAILRGLTPAEAVPIAMALYETDFRLIEVPLNSPEPLASIAAIRGTLGSDALVGAGTVLSVAAVDQVRAAGGDLIVMPHADTTVIRAAKAAGAICVPGVATPTEAFAALDAGADALKLFPAELVTPAALRALRAVLPTTTALYPVGGITPETMQAYREAGATGFGLGSALYVPGAGVAAVKARAAAFRAAWRR
jgi:2-dehydro-3-deoxyphosphogalactonate aldolase